MVRARFATLCVVFWISLSTAQASILPIPIFGTGMDVNGVLLGDSLTDPHYTIISRSDGIDSTTAYVATGATPAEALEFGVPVSWPRNPGTWIASTTNKWIAPRADVINMSGFGTYMYRTTFDLTGFDPLTAVLTGRFSIDNISGGVLLNGVLIPDTTTADIFSFQSFFTLSITSGFIAGVNTLDFIVGNTVVGNTFPNPNPTGLLAEITGFADVAVPEPATLGLLGFGLTGVLVLCSRRQRS